MRADLLDLGIREYGEVWSHQLKLVSERALNKVSDTLILVEHPDVITVGRKSQSPEVKGDFPIFNIERGGQATYHGPGQLVGYPIINIGQRGLGIVTLVRLLEEVLIRTADDFGVEATRVEAKPGVWLHGGKKKLASIGLAVRHWVTFHGFALNVSTRLSRFDIIRPCGMDSSTMTSLEECRSTRVSMQDVKASVVSNFEALFGYEMVPRHAE